MSADPHRIALRRTLATMTADGAASSVMVGVGESYLAAFALALGFADTVAGLVASVPVLAGAALQLASPWAVRRLGSHRRWVVICATTQTLSFVPLALAAAWSRASLVILFAAGTLYWAAGLASGSAWNAWVETLVPPRLHQRYFARRSMVAQVGVLCGLLGGGLLLQLAHRHGTTAAPYAALFVAAAVARAVSALLLSRQPEPVPRIPGFHTVSPRAWIAAPRNALGVRLLLYMLAMQLSVHLAAPYFTPFMFRKLHLSYFEFAVVTATIFIARGITLVGVGQASHALSARTTLWIGGLGVVPLASLWIVSGALGYLVVIQILSGAFWACYELATFLLFFKSISRDERTSVLSLFNLANAAAMVVGSTLGGVLLRLLGESRRAYTLLFALSSAGRALALPLLARIPAVPVRVSPVPTRPLSVRPGAAGLQRPILPGLATDEVGTVAAHPAGQGGAA